MLSDIVDFTSLAAESTPLEVSQRQSQAQWAKKME